MALLPSVIHAQIATDGTVGAAHDPDEPTHHSGCSGEHRRTQQPVCPGNSHINAGQSANFTTTTALDNVISRVTGGSVSTINGQLH